jgi:hypothetical protein
MNMSSLKEQIMPGFLAHETNKIIDLQYQKLFEKEADQLVGVPKLSVYIDQIKFDIEKQRDRKKGIEDKAKTVFATIGLSITAITFSLNYNNLNLKSPVGIVSTVLLLLSILYFIMATIRAMQTINVRQFHVYQIEAKETEKTVIIQELGDEQTQVRNLIMVKLLNDKIISKLSNYAWASFVLLRNGIILFALYFITALVQKAFFNQSKPSSLTLILKDSVTNTVQKVYTNIQNKQPDSVFIRIDSIKHTYDTTK